jgi:MscS family membrane protein
MIAIVSALTPARWLEQYMPELARTYTFWDMPLWKWAILPALLALAWGVGHVAGWLTRRVGGKIAARTETLLDDHALPRLQGPATLLWTCLAARVLLPLLEPGGTVLQGAIQLAHAGMLVAFFWGLFRLVDTFAEGLSRARWASERPASRALIPLGGRVAKVVVGAMAVVAMVAMLGYSVTSLIAGLGIGGLALALAAQKTVENLFGAFAMGIDQPFRPGDAIKAGDLSGTVERVGLRSTRVRTENRTLVSIPNGKLADAQIESFAERDRIRLGFRIGLVYGTTSTQVRSILGGIDEILRRAPEVHTPDVSVRLVAMGDSGLMVDVAATFQTTELSKFAVIRENILLEVMEVVEKAGTHLALPSQTIYLGRQPASQRRT